MAESRLAQFATSPLLSNFAATASQKAIRPVGNFVAPLCPVPDLTFRYKKYTEINRYRVPTGIRRQPGARATQISFSADDVQAVLEPNALDFPIPGIDQLSDDGAQFAIMEGQSALADASALSLELEILSEAKTAALASPLNQTADFSDDGVDPIALLDFLCIQVAKAVKNGAPVRILFGATKFKQFRNNANVKRRYIVAADRAASSRSVGLLSPRIEDIGGMLMLKPQTAVSYQVFDASAPGKPENIQFLLDDIAMIFACADDSNRTDPSFMKTFTRDKALFRAGAYTSEDERDQTLKMDWTTLPIVTNPAAVALA